MIGRLAGTVIEKTPPLILLDVSGVGYEVSVPMSTFCNLPAEGGKVVLLTHLIVREDAHLLFGFATPGERNVFRALLKVSGIGPRIALAILSGMKAEDVVAAVENQQSSLLTRIPGIGKKTAERLVLELKGKLLGLVPTGLQTATSSATNDVLSALIALGYSDKEAQAAVKGLDPDTSVSEGIRLALKQLSH